MRKFALFQKIKAGLRAWRGCCKTRKQLTAYYGLQHKSFKSNNIHPKCQIAVMLFIMLQNSFKATKRSAEAKSGNAGVVLRVWNRHNKIKYGLAGNTLIKRAGTIPGRFWKLIQS